MYQKDAKNTGAISIKKTEFMVFGPLPSSPPVLLVYGHKVNLVDSFKYVGAVFGSTTRDIFLAHYQRKASKARNVANATFAAEQMIGSLPPSEGVRLYMARVDPHLTFGCEIMLDVDDKGILLLERVQLNFLRRLLHVNRRSERCFLFTETGMMPIRARRVLLALGYLKYILSLSPRTLAHTAFRHQITLTYHGYPCWLSDLRLVLARIRVPPALLANSSLFSCEGVDVVVQLVKDLTASQLDMDLRASSKLWLLQQRVEFDSKGSPLPPTPHAFRHYLKALTIPKHRKAYVHGEIEMG
ncbi:hypothetical protein VNI00_007872 [Paramarasmius palmivorus]|uniref:Uncharacterized protein n=1 Tax=Paramarasmius palmivorus TaxID=297713 RepID=A0AAW0CVF0_9AGAR